MKIIEFYAGSCQFSGRAKQRGHETFTIDITQFGNVDLVIDAREVTVEMLPFIPDVLWFGIPCTSWSLAGISHHRNHDLSPKSEFAKISNQLLEHNLKLIKELKKLNPDLIWFFENPRATLRKMPQMTGIDRTTVTYCSFGDMRMKPTDIWSNDLFNLFNQSGWKSRPMCFNGNEKCHHERAPRGSRTGIQGLKNNHERSKMPLMLIMSIIRHLEKRFK